MSSNPLHPYKRVLSASSIYLLGQGLVAAGRLVAIPLYARLFSTTEFGVLSLVWVLLNVGSVLGSNWITSSIVRFLPQYSSSEMRRLFLRTVAVLSFYSSALIVVLSLITQLGLRRLFPDHSIWEVFFLSMAIAVSMNLVTVIQTLFRSVFKPSYYVLLGILQSYGSLGLGYYFVKQFGMGISGILWGMLVVNVFIVLLLLATQFGRFKRNSPEAAYSRELGREFMIYGIPSGIAALGSWLLNLSDRFVLEYFRSTEEVGLYSMGSTLADRGIFLFITSFMLAVSPALIHCWENEGRRKTEKELRRFTRWFILLFTPIVVGACLVSDLVVEVFATSKYAPSAAIVPWIALGSAFYGFSLLSYSGLLLRKDMRTIAFIFLGTGALNVLLNVLTVPRYGFVAAGVNTAISNLILLLVNAKFSDEHLRWEIPWLAAWKACLASILMGIFIWGLMQWLEGPAALRFGATLGAAALFYSIALAFLGELKIRLRF